MKLRLLCHRPALSVVSLQIQEVSAMFAGARARDVHQSQVLLRRNSAFNNCRKQTVMAADLTGRASLTRCGRSRLDIIKARCPRTMADTTPSTGKTHKAVYSQLTSDTPIDLNEYQLANCFTDEPVSSTK